jgi:hypothetical protein
MFFAYWILDFSRILGKVRSLRAWWAALSCRDTLGDL